MRLPPVIVNPWLPGKRFAAITLFGMVFTRRRDAVNHRVLNHEHIHCRQQLEWLYLPFFILYGLEYLWHLIRLRDPFRAYMAISFEREAYDNDHDFGYLKHRRPYANYRKQ